MARLLEGAEAEEALIEHTGIDKNQLHAKLLELAGHVERISGKDPSIMLNLLTSATATVVAEIERQGEANVLDVTLNTIRTAVERFRVNAKTLSN